MERGVRRRLDALLALASGIFALVVTDFLVGFRTTPLVVFFAATITGMVFVLVLWYVDSASVPP